MRGEGCLAVPAPVTVALWIARPRPPVLPGLCRGRGGARSCLPSPGGGHGECCRLSSGPSSDLRQRRSPRYQPAAAAARPSYGPSRRFGAAAGGGGVRSVVARPQRAADC